jgi:sec-independent protein translocase protein TatC
LKDGLNKKEKNLFFILLPTGMFLFASGFLYCFTILYFYLNSISAINLAFNIQNVWDISSFLSQVIFASICFGFVFQFPIILTFLIRVGLLDLKFLIEKRIYAISAMFIFVGFLPPPDIFSTIFQALPLVCLYQVTLWVNSAINKAYLVDTKNQKVEKVVIESAIYE